MKTWWIILQIVISLPLWYPGLLLFIASLRKSFLSKKAAAINTEETDFAIIVTAYEQFDLVDDVVFSILNNVYSNYIIYIVADKCNIDNIRYDSEKVVLLRPPNVLGSNIRSHFYAIENFKRAHKAITIIDSDNMVHKSYLHHINEMFKAGHNAIQGVRAARNLNTFYARLDEAGDMYYRFIDRKLLFEAGSSSSLAGSGMAFNTNLYIACMKGHDKTGAGFDKLLQYELVKRNEKIAFCENAIVYDGKTAQSDQLVKQRARWINTWFRFWILAIKLFFQSLIKISWNRFAFSLMLLRPPIFIVAFISAIFITLSAIMQPVGLYVWGGAILIFVITFFCALFYFKAPKSIYRALVKIPYFIYCQIMALLKVRVANKLSVATKHDATAYTKEIKK
ncbi:MAG: glycosyltransferase [Niabella sp.]